MDKNNIIMSIDFFQSDGILYNRACLSGVYICELSHSSNLDKINNIPLYIGESNCMLRRCTIHLNRVFNNPSYFGLTDDMLQDSECKLIFRVLENHAKRKVQSHETRLIKIRRPILQKGEDIRGKPDHMLHENIKLCNVKKAYEKLKENVPAMLHQ